GYTPVHIASLHKHEMIVHLLVHTYGADASLRDYSGKRADQYPDNYVRVVAGHKTIERRPLKPVSMFSDKTTATPLMMNLRGRVGLVARSRLRGRRVPSSKPYSTESPQCMETVARRSCELPAVQPLVCCGAHVVLVI
ncbi:hypothetical protein AVEN_6527-1, partial [Araneus ventricosus]